MIEENSYSYFVLLFLGVLLIKTLLSFVLHHEPLKIFRFYCEQLANKVNNPKNSDQQRKIAGAVAILITLTPSLIILWLFADFIVVSWMWEALLLYLALGSPSFSPEAQKIASALHKQDKDKAKSILKPWVLRDTDVLSNMGLAKTTIEMVLLRTAQGIIGVGFYFLIGGGLCALAYRLILEMHYSWNSKKTNFTFFGAMASALSNVLQWFPTRIFTVILMLCAIGRNTSQCIKSAYGTWFLLNNNLLLNTLATLLNVQLGGVAMYNKSKLRRIAFNSQANQPQESHIFNAVNTIRLSLVLIGLSLLTTAFLPLLMTSH